MYEDEPDSVAMENLQRSLFPSSRLGAPVAGSEASLRPLRPEDLRRYVKAHYLPSNTVVVVVGRFDPDEAFGIVSRWQKGYNRCGQSAEESPGSFGKNAG